MSSPGLSAPRWFDLLVQDLRCAFRGLRLRPAFAIAVVLTLALGVGANAAMFALVDRMLIRPPPLLRDPATAHRIYGFQTFRGKERAGFGGQYAVYKDLQNFTSSFSSMAGFTERKVAVGVGDAAREMQIGVVSWEFFGFFDAPPVLGRYFTSAEDQPPAGEAVAVLSYPMWETAYGRRKDILGTAVQIGSVTYTIIGVAAKGFVGLWPDQPPAAFIPMTNYGAATIPSLKETWWTTYHYGWMQVIARRKPGVTLAAANGDLTQAMVKSYQAQLVTSPRMPPLTVARPRAIAGSILLERGPNESSFAKVASWLSGVALIVLLIACANVANLLLARALRRRREIALRLALGVTRARLLSQLLTESLILAVAGGAAGMIVAQLSSAMLRSAFLPAGSVQQPVAGDTRTLLFALLAAVAAGVLTGLAPAWQLRHSDIAGELKAGTREGTYQRSRTRVALLVAQGALSVVLLVGAGLFVRSLNNVQALRLGYDVDPVLLVDLSMRGVTLDSAQSVQLRHKLLDAAGTVSGVSGATLTGAIPFWSYWSENLFVEGIDTVSRLGQFDLNDVSPSYFATLGTRLVRGRGFTSADVAGAPRVMVVSQAMAATLWPREDALGKCVRMNADTMPCFSVVGIAENIKNTSLGDDPGLYYYIPAAQFDEQHAGLFVRAAGAGEASAGGAAALMEPLRKRLQQEMPGASYVTITRFSDILSGQTRSWQLGATLFTAFGALALVLAAIGLYSVIAYNVAQRTHELGVRVALGAQMRDVVRLVVVQGVRFGLAGVVIGGGVALVAGRWVKPLLFEESPRDPVVYALVILALLGVAIAASWIPAMRAARVDPNVALRAD